MTPARPQSVGCPPTRRGRPCSVRCSIWAVLGLLCGRRASEERGQVIPLAAVGVLALALAVMATANLGQAVHSKIKLQNAADSAAYSLAAMEARTFNYIAFLNRTQIAHYNTAMVVQSYITWVGFHVALFGSSAAWIGGLYGILEKGRKWVCTKCDNGEGNAWCLGCKALSMFALAVGKVALMLEASGRAITFIYQQAAQLGHQIVEAIHLFNRDVIWQAQAWRAVLMNVSLMSGMSSQVARNDPGVTAWKGKQALLTAASAALNSYEYYQAFDEGAGVNPFWLTFFTGLARIAPGGEYTPSKVAADARKSWSSPSQRDPEVEAYRVMAELCNASRWPRFVYNRGQNMSFRVRTGWAQLTGRKMGQTRFISAFDAASELETDAQIKGLMHDDTPYTGSGAMLTTGQFRNLASQAQGKLDAAVGRAAKGAASSVSTAKKVDKDGKPIKPKGFDAALGDSGYRYSLGRVLASNDYLIGTGGAGWARKGIGIEWQGGNAALGDAVAAYIDEPPAKYPDGKHYQYMPQAHAVLSGEDSTGPLADLSKANEQVSKIMDKAGDTLTGVQDLMAQGADFGPVIANLNNPQKAMDALAKTPVMAAAVEQGKQVVDQAVSQAAETVMAPVKEWVSANLMAPAEELANKVGESVKGALADLDIPGFDQLSGPEGTTAVHRHWMLRGVDLKAYRKARTTMKPAKDKWHAPWPGFAPYFKFNASSERTADFNQPSTWIFLHKGYKTFQGKGDQPDHGGMPWVTKLTWRHGSGVGTLDTTGAGKMLFEGFNAWARGMAYYHRPSARGWNEQPNFFNPFWRARLAPMAQKMQAFWERWVGSQITTDMNNLVVQAVVNAIRNAQMELFTATVTSLATH